MARKLVKFIKGYSRYNKGETAAFDEGMAEKLTTGKGKVAVIFGDADDPNAGQSVVIGKLDTSEAQAFLSKVRVELEGRAMGLEVRGNLLEQKAQDLADREKALEAREAASTTGATVENPTLTELDKTAENAAEKTTTKTKGSGEPPTQGAKT